MTTTTAAAGLVMRHLEFVLQVLRPDLDARVISASEQWAQFGVAGPKSRELLNGLLDQGIDDLPFMCYANFSVGGVKARLFWISFSGEMAFEVAVPARFGAA